MNDEAQRSGNTLDAKGLWEKALKNPAIMSTYPNCLLLLETLMIFPLSASVVERLFSRLKLTKTRLRNKMLQDALDKMLMISKEGKDKLAEKDINAIFKILKKNNPNMRK